MSDLIIRIHKAPFGALSAFLVERKDYTETVIDTVAGCPLFVMELVNAWLDVSENLSTKEKL